MVKLFIRDNPQKQTKLYCCKQLSNMLFLILAFNSLILLLNVTQSSILIDSYYIKRPSYGETGKEVPIIVNIDDGQANMPVILKERHYTKQEDIDRIFRLAEKYLDDTVLNKNERYEHIVTDIYLPHRIDHLNVSVKWELDELGIIQPDGKIKLEITEENRKGIVTTITAIISYYDQEEYYPIILDVYPVIPTKQETLLYKIQESILKAQVESPEEEYLQLPHQVDSQSLSYQEPKTKDYKIFNILGIAAIICIACGSYTQLQQENKKREKQMLLEYPSIVNKIVLLVGAGMTVKNAWGKICTKYESNLQDNNIEVTSKKKLRKRKVHKRYAYEEMLATYYDLCNGVPETEAYDHFGRRIQLVPYMKLSSLLMQNIKKGPSDLLRSLEYEAIQAIEDRKELAKKLGEEAGTKLLAPMIFMLGIVLVILMVPAFLQM